MHGPLQLFTVIALVSLPTVMYGGYALMTLRTLTDAQRASFRAGHAHAGVLLVLALVALQILSRTSLPEAVLWVACFLLLFGVLGQSGGFFLRLIPGRGRLGGLVTSGGAVLLAAAMLLTAYGIAST